MSVIYPKKNRSLTSNGKSGMHPERSELALASFLQDLPDFGGAKSERAYRDLQDLPDLLTVGKHCL